MIRWLGSLLRKSKHRNHKTRWAPLLVWGDFTQKMVSHVSFRFHRLNKERTWIKVYADCLMLQSRYTFLYLFIWDYLVLLINVWWSIYQNILPIWYLIIFPGINHLIYTNCIIFKLSSLPSCRAGKENAQYEGSGTSYEPPRREDPGE